MNIKTAVLAVFLPGAVLAQTAEPELDSTLMPVTMYGVCSPSGTAYLAERKAVYGETPLFFSQGYSFILDEQKVVDAIGVLTVLLNQDTGTVSVAMLYPDGVACEILTGINFEPQ